jgi:5'(3')-deoxyribonucleotidase
VKHRILLLDCDGVLADFVTGYLQVIRDTTGRDHRFEEVDRFDMHDALGLTPSEAAACKRALSSRLAFARWLIPYEDAQVAVRRLQQLSELYIVTAPWSSHPTWTHDREAWLKQHFDIPSSHVVHTSAKHLVRGDVFVDDRTDACARWRDEHPLGVAVRWDTPHNQLESWDGERTRSWQRLVEIVEAA